MKWRDSTTKCNRIGAGTQLIVSHIVYSDYTIPPAAGLVAYYISTPLSLYYYGHYYYGQGNRYSLLISK